MNVMSMRSKSKATSWKYDGVRGKKYNKKYANTYQRRENKRMIEDDAYCEYQ